MGHFAKHPSPRITVSRGRSSAKRPLENTYESTIREATDLSVFACVTKINTVQFVE